MRGLKLQKFLEGYAMPKIFKTPEDVQSNTINSAFLNYDQQD